MHIDKKDNMRLKLGLTGMVCQIDPYSAPKFKHIVSYSGIHVCIVHCHLDIVHACHLVIY